jgi:hypothetical protein
LDPGFAASLPDGVAARLLNPVERAPVVQQWNLSAMHSISGNLQVEAAYLGSSNHHLSNTYDLAQCKADPDNRCRAETRSYARYSSLITVENNGNSSYEAGILTLHYRNTKGLNVRAEYAIAKALTDTSELVASLEHQIASCRRCEKALTAFDQRQRFVVSGIYPIPVGRGQTLGRGFSRPADLLLGGWQTSVLATFSSGAPIDQIAPNTTASALIFHRPDRICDGRSSALAGNLRNNGFQYYDPNCFVPAAPGYFGNAGRNIVGSPGINNWDLALNKGFAFTESKHAEVRIELFNAWNHSQFGTPNRFLGPNLGRVSSARAPRLMQLSLQFHW